MNLEPLATPRTDLSPDEQEKVILVAVGLLHRAGLKATITAEPNGNKTIRIKMPRAKKVPKKRAGKSYRA